MTSPAKPETPEEIAVFLGGWGVSYARNRQELADAIRAYGDRRAKEMRERAAEIALSAMRRVGMASNIREVIRAAVVGDDEEPLP